MSNTDFEKQVNDVHLALIREDEEIHKAIGDIVNGRGPNLPGRTVQPHMTISPERAEWLIIQRWAAKDAITNLVGTVGSDKAHAMLQKFYSSMPRIPNSRCRTVRLTEMELEH